MAETDAHDELPKDSSAIVIVNTLHSSSPLSSSTNSSQIRTLAFPFRGHSVQLRYLERQSEQVYELNRVGVALWPACLALCTYLANQHGEHFFAHKAVLELGSGAGLLGIALAKLGARVTFTDADSADGVLELLKENVSNNLNLSLCEVARVVQPLNWGEILHAGIRGPYQIIVGADVVYHKQAVPLLIAAMCAVSGPDSLLYIAFQEHNLEAVEEFCELAPKYFYAKDVSRKRLARLCGEYYRRDMHIVCLKRRPPGAPARALHMDFVRIAGLFDHTSGEEDIISETSSSDSEFL